MTGAGLTPIAEVMAGVGEEWQLLCRIDALIYDLKVRLEAIRTDQGDSVAARRALDTWHQLDELGVDLNVPDLKTLLATIAAGQQTSGGSNPGEPISSNGSLPLPPEQTSDEAVTAQSTPAGTDAAGSPADTTPASPDPDSQPGSLYALAYDRELEAAGLIADEQDD